MSMNFKTLVRRGVNRYLASLIISLWRAKGSSIPTPHSMKQRVILDYAARYGAKCLVETGTYRGDMVDAMKDRFLEIHSIEVFEPLFVDAVRQFKRHSNIHIHLGNSADVFVGLLPKLNGPVLFWLDGHFSGEGTGGFGKLAPVMGELQQIGKITGDNVILIDDAREFTGRNGYPSVDELRQWATANDYDEFEVVDDIMRIHHRCDNALSRQEGGK